MTPLTRRAFGTLAAAAGFAPGMARAAPPVPLIIAEGGSAAERPEDSRSAFDEAIDDGADFIQANLVPTKDGVLIARRDNELSATTDVAAHTEFADRRTTKTIDGQQITGWFSEDFTLAEVRTLTCRTRLGAFYPQSLKFDGKDAVLTLDELLALARAGCVRTARTIGVMPRMLHVAYFATLDIPVEEKLAQTLNSDGYNAAAAAIWVQAFEPQALKSISRLTRVRRMQMIDTPGAGPTPPGVDWGQMITTSGLSDVRAYADAVGVNQGLVVDPGAAIYPAPTTLVLDAHSVGLVVHTWTARGANAFLPRVLQRGNPNSANFPQGRGDFDKLLVGLFAGGADGVSTDLPSQAVRSRRTAIDQISRGQRG